MFAACCLLVSTMIDVGTVDSVQESQRLWLLSGRLFERESTAACVGEWTALQKRVDSSLEGEWKALQKRVNSGLKGEWIILQKRIDSGSKVVGSLTERRDHDRLFDRKA